MSKSIGEEVIQWAEKYWHIDKVCKNELPKEGEQFQYEYFRRVIIQKIESEINNRLFPENSVLENNEKYNGKNSFLN